MRRSVVRLLSARLVLDVATMAVFFRIASVLARRVGYSPLSYDERFYIYGGYSILHGEVPFKDFQNLKGPLLSMSEAVGIKLFGLEHQGYRELPLAMAIGSMTLVVGALLQRGVYRLLALGFGLLIGSIYLDPGFHDSSLNDAESFVLGYFFAGLACLLVCARSRAQRGFWFFGGAFLCAAMLVKENFLPVSVATWLMFMFAPRSGPRRPYALSYAVWTVGGALVTGLGVAGYLAAKGGFVPYVELIFALPKYAKNYCVQIGQFTPAGNFLDDRKLEWSRLKDGLFNLSHLVPWTPFILTTVILARRKNLLFVLLAFLGFSASLVVISIGHCYWKHYFALGATGLALLLIPGIDAICAEPRDARHRAWIGAAMSSAAFFMLLPTYLDQEPKHPEPVVEAVPARYSQAIEQYSHPNDFILTTGTPDLYFLTGRLGSHETNCFVDELLDMYPGNTDTERVEKMRAMLERKRPKVVVLDTSPEAHQPRSVRTVGALVKPYLSDHHYVSVSDGVFVRPDLAH